MLNPQEANSLKVLKCACCSYTTEKSFNLKRHTNAVHKTNKQDNKQENINTKGNTENFAILDRSDRTATENFALLDRSDSTATENIALLDRSDNCIVKKLYKCPTCYKEFTRQIRLQHHIPACTKISSALECEKCHKMYANPSSLCRHKQRCRYQKNKIAMLEDEIFKLKQQQTNIINNNINSHNINTNNTNNGVIVNINGLGKENIDYITQSPKFKKFMTKCIKNKTGGIIDYLETKHFHPKHPENHNLKKLTKKDDFIEFHDGKKWKFLHRNDLMRCVFDNMQLAFADFVDSTMKDGKLKKVWIDNFMQTVGTPLEWDVDCDDYEFDKKMTDEQKKFFKDKVYTHAIEYIYRNSKNRENNP